MRSDCSAPRSTSFLFLSIHLTRGLEPLEVLLCSAYIAVHSVHVHHRLGTSSYICMYSMYRCMHTYTLYTPYSIIQVLSPACRAPTYMHRQEKRGAAAYASLSDAALGFRHARFALHTAPRVIDVLRRLRPPSDANCIKLLALRILNRIPDRNSRATFCEG